MAVFIKFSGGKVSIVGPEQIKIINNKCYAPAGMLTMTECEILYYEAD